MRKNKGRTSSPIIETLEGRALLSATGVDHAAMHADTKAPSAVTQTKLQITGAVLGQADTLNVTVRAAAGQGSPAGTVTVSYKGAVQQTLTLTPATSTNAKYAISTATIQIPSGAGNPDYYFGTHHFVGKYVPSGSLKASTGGANLVVKMPKYQKQSDGLKIATVVAGSGTAITAGQTATMEYTGYLVKNGSVFDYSSEHSPGTFSFEVDASPEQVIPGFDQGVLGMQPGETRVLWIPSKLGYGKQGAGSSIPPNSNLIFLITLVSIS